MRPYQEPFKGLGLKRGKVSLAEHSPAWRDAFRREHGILARALASVSCAIEHIGSTAVPGLEAKPILDIAIGIEGHYLIETCIPALEAAGYIYRGENPDHGHLFVREFGEQVRTHHLHVVRRGDPNWKRWLAFRDYLRENGAAREIYVAEKTRLAALYGEDRKSYTLGKTHVIGSLLARAQRAEGM